MARRLSLFSSIPFCAALLFAQTPPPVPELPRIVRVEPGVLEKMALARQDAIQPPLLKPVDLPAKAVLDVVVDETGAVRNVKTISVHPRLRDAAERAAKQWRFSPPRVNGRVSIVVGRIEVPFAAPETAAEPSEIQVARAAVREHPGDPRLHYALAAACERSERYESAVESLTEALRLEPGFEEACVLMGKMYGRIGNFPLQERIYSRFLEKKPDSASVLKALLQFALDHKAYDTAAEFASNVEVLRSKDPVMLVLIGDVNARRGRFEEAVRAYDEALTFDPDNAAVHAKLGAELLSVRQFRDAETALTRAIRLDPTLRAAYHSLGRLYGVTRRGDKGVETYRTCIRNTHRDLDDLEEDYHVMGELLIPLRRLDQAEEVLNQALELKPDVGEIYCHLGDIERLRGRSEKAVDVLRRGIEVQRDVPCLHGLLGHALTHLNRPKEAEEALKQAIGLAPGNPSGYLQLVELLVESERLDEAVSVMNQVREISPNDYRVHLQLGEVYSRMRREADAERELRAALRLRPTDPQVLNNVGYSMLEWNKDLNEALKMIERAVAADPENASFLDSLGWAHFKLGRLDLAEKYIAAAQEKGEKSATVTEHLGDVYMKQGKDAMAKEKWREALARAENNAQSERLKQKLGGNED